MTLFGKEQGKSLINSETINQTLILADDVTLHHHVYETKYNEVTELHDGQVRMYFIEPIKNHFIIITLHFGQCKPRVPKALQ